MKAPRWWSDAFSELNAALGLLAALLLAAAVFSWAVDSDVVASWLVAGTVGAIAVVLALMYRKAARERDDAIRVDETSPGRPDSFAGLEQQP